MRQYRFYSELKNIGFTILALTSSFYYLTNQAQATETTPIYSMTEILSKIPADLHGSVCGFDIDGTLIEPASTDFTRRVPVESATPGILLELAARGCTVIAITARVPGPRTAEELKDSGFAFFVDPTFHRPMGFVNHVLFAAETGNVEYRDGILFGSNIDKGVVLKALLQSREANPSQITPRYVTFVDDALSEGRNVLREMKGQGIPHFVFRYLAPDREHFEY